MRSLDPEDFSGVVQPVLEKLQKKNPDSVLAAVASLVKHLTIDLSVYITLFLPPLLRQLRSSKEHVRRIGLELIGSLAARCADPEVRLPPVWVASVSGCCILVLALWFLTVVKLSAVRIHVFVVSSFW